MSRYSFLDINLNSIYDINDKTFMLENDDFNFQIDITERNYEDGADYYGRSRLKSKDLKFKAFIVDSSVSDFITIINQFFYFARAAVYLKNNDLNKITKILLSDSGLSYDLGNAYHMSEVSFSFKQLIPAWEDSSFSTVSYSAVSDQYLEFIINNTGVMETPPIITITALENITKFYIKIAENNNGIFISDFQFGLNGLYTYIIDCGKGTALLEGLDRSNKIADNTGFFKLLVGQNTVQVGANGVFDFELKYRKRNFI